ncbi:hypothetical protein AKJ56_00340 [candidate division MSBL1 archaeon SCGC-AAA382N08]|uniref:Uncharacterized protein n=1 Tax=candidate division MSBL1 archaeon SCGC-AAA382N08 TaxID=1698285 RepID=A0A133VQR5_9EURY|nr:hypothetical protein AKJ56_00340 [candidate division MSBL1 archaeon SCGC-AAA382N08]
MNENLHTFAKQLGEKSTDQREEELRKALAQNKSARELKEIYEKLQEKRPAVITVEAGEPKLKVRNK